MVADERKKQRASDSAATLKS